MMGTLPTLTARQYTPTPPFDLKRAGELGARVRLWTNGLSQRNAVDVCDEACRLEEAVWRGWPLYAYQCLPALEDSLLGLRATKLREACLVKLRELKRSPEDIVNQTHQNLTPVNTPEHAVVDAWLHEAKQVLDLFYLGAEYVRVDELSVGDFIFWDGHLHRVLEIAQPLKNHSSHPHIMVTLDERRDPLTNSSLITYIVEEKQHHWKPGMLVCRPLGGAVHKLTDNDWFAEARSASESLSARQFWKAFCLIESEELRAALLQKAKRCAFDEPLFEGKPLDPSCFERFLAILSDRSAAGDHVMRRRQAAFQVP